jgi:lipopolysaccharide transport system ATP-binding protein
MRPIIELRHIGKRYTIDHQRGGYVALRDVLTYIIKRPLRFLTERAKRAAGVAGREEFWALKDVSFAINKGEVVGIIGRNGAGKSTLLKILTGITPPTEGEAVLRGRVSSLLEVGTGFHPELTGRENIFLNGAILGMTRREIARKFDEIVAFAGVEQFIDTPVKYYSSGMYVRLAFSVAAHMEPDILIVDEVLAVGDAEFQKKCLGKMEEVTRTEGRTIIFVSHNMAAIQRLCNKTVLLENGRVKKFGPTHEVIAEYLLELQSSGSEWSGRAGDEHIVITHTSVKSLDPAGTFHTAAPVEIRIEGEVLRPVRDLILGVTLFSEFGYELAYVLADDKEAAPSPEAQPGPFTKRFVIPANTLASGMYLVELDVGIHRTKRIVKEEGGLSFTLENSEGLGRRFPITNIKGKTSLFRPHWSK